MITIDQIKAAIAAKDYPELRALHDRAKTEGIEWCDEHTLSTVNLCMLECSLFRDTSPGHLRTLSAMLCAVERGNHPYDDMIAMSEMGAEGAIAKAQLDASLGRK